MNKYKYAIVGSGIAGLYTALLAEKHGSVLVITKGSIDDCNTKHAQGGIAAAIGRKDSPELHFKDTIAVGGGLCNEEAVRILTGEASDRITDLVNYGVPFDTMNGAISMTMEAAHSLPRVLHAGGDATGEHIEDTLSRQVRSGKIKVLEYCLATDILVDDGVVRGVKALDCRTGSIEEYECDYLILATGGGGQLFKFNTNSEVATGDGIALAYKAKAEIMDMEFFQFHPTALQLPGVPPFLISEAVRGEGGVLRNENGHLFMRDYTSDGDLAPRDVVARSILYEMEKTDSRRVFIDVTHLPSTVITTRFPHIYKFCLDHGLDITHDLIPVAPAAHYMMGGVRTNIWGETNIAGLFAVGETACAGVHGANRLASNSLMEVLVFSKRIIERTRNSSVNKAVDIRQNNEIRLALGKKKAVIEAPPLGLSSLQKLLWEKVGIIRNKQGLATVAETMTAWWGCLSIPTDRYSYELNNLVLTGRLMTEAALIREESRGAHFRSEFPHTSPDWQRHIVFTGE